MIPDAKLQHLRYFVLVAELKSYRAAADRAARTQPAISLALRELEHRLGQPLFERGNKTELTPFGRHCLPEAKALLDHYQQAVEHMALAAESRIGRVSIACVPSFAGELLPDILSRYATEHPDVHISVEDDTALNVRHRVLEGRVDFGVASLYQPDPNLDFEPLMTDEMGLVCRADHSLAARGRPLAWADLVGQKLISNGSCRLLEGTPAQHVMERAQFSVSNMISLKAVLRAGLGITSLPRLTHSPGESELVFIELREPRVERVLGLVSRRGQSLSPVAQSLRRRIREQLDVPGALGETR